MKLPELKPYDYAGKVKEILGGGPQDHATLKSQFVAYGRECAASALMSAAFYIIDSCGGDAFPQDKFRREAAALRRLNK